jgi:hypothetical protein
MNEELKKLLNLSVDFNAILDIYNEAASKLRKSSSPSKALLESILKDTRDDLLTALQRHKISSSI